MHDGHMLIHGYTAEHPTSCLERTARVSPREEAFCYLPARRECSYWSDMPSLYIVGCRLCAPFNKRLLSLIFGRGSVHVFMSQLDTIWLRERVCVFMRRFYTVLSARRGPLFTCEARGKAAASVTHRAALYATEWLMAGNTADRIQSVIFDWNTHSRQTERVTDTPCGWYQQHRWCPMTRGLSSTSSPRRMTAPRGPVQTPDPSPLSPGACQWGPLLGDSAVTRPLKALPLCSVSPALRPAFGMTCLGVIVWGPLE